MVSTISTSELPDSQGPSRAIISSSTGCQPSAGAVRVSPRCLIRACLIVTPLGCHRVPPHAGLGHPWYTPPSQRVQAASGCPGRLAAPAALPPRSRPLRAGADSPPGSRQTARSRADRQLPLTPAPRDRGRASSAAAAGSRWGRTPGTCRPRYRSPARRRNRSAACCSPAPCAATCPRASRLERAGRRRCPASNRSSRPGRRRRSSTSLRPTPASRPGLREQLGSPARGSGGAPACCAPRWSPDHRAYPVQSRTGRRRDPGQPATAGSEPGRTPAPPWERSSRCHQPRAPAAGGFPSPGFASSRAPARPPARGEAPHSGTGGGSFLTPLLPLELFEPLAERPAGKDACHIGVGVLVAAAVTVPVATVCVTVPAVLPLPGQVDEAAVAVRLVGELPVFVRVECLLEQHQLVLSQCELVGHRGTSRTTVTAPSASLAVIATTSSDPASRTLTDCESRSRITRSTATRHASSRLA